MAILRTTVCLMAILVGCFLASCGEQPTSTPVPRATMAAMPIERNIIEIGWGAVTIPDWSTWSAWPEAGGVSEEDSCLAAILSGERDGLTLDDWPISEENQSLVERQPGYITTVFSGLADADAEVTGPRGLIIVVEEIIDQDTLLATDRLPNCLDGIPVQFMEVGNLAPSIGLFFGAGKPHMSEPCEITVQELEPGTPEYQAELERIEEIMERHLPMFQRQPGFMGIRVAQEWTEDFFDNFGLLGIAVFVVEDIDQTTLPVADRIPDCIEGVPVRRYAVGNFTTG